MPSPTERSAQRKLRMQSQAAADDAQLRHIRALLAAAHNPITRQRGIALEHVRQLATAQELRGSDEALNELFKGHAAFDAQTGVASAWAIDLALMLDLSVETCFGPHLQYRAALPVQQAQIAIAYHRAIGEHSKILDGRVTIVPPGLPLENPIKLHADHQPVHISAFDDRIRLRDEVMSIDEALAVFDHVLETMPNNYKTPRSITPRILQLLHGFDRLALREGEKETFTLTEIATMLKLTRARVSQIAKEAEHSIRTRVGRNIRSDVQSAPRLPKPQVVEEAPFTANDAIRIMLTPDFLQSHHNRMHELLDEAKLLRNEQKKALAQKECALRNWDKSRNADTNAALEDAYERADILQHHITTLIKDLEKFRVLSPRNVQSPKPEPQS